MFKCTNCNSVDKFELMFASNYQGEKVFSQVYNSEGILEITVDGYTFIPTLDFMNDHAVCSYCGQIYKWKLGD